jgi:hypothetical protein
LGSGQLSLSTNRLWAITHPLATPLDSMDQTVTIEIFTVWKISTRQIEENVLQFFILIDSNEL